MRKEKISTRILALLLVALTIIGFFPSAIMTANAGEYIQPGTPSLVTGKLNAANDDGTLTDPPTPPDEIALSDYQQVTGGHYTILSKDTQEGSPNQSTSISHFTVDFNVNGIKTKGYCTEYGKGIGSGYTQAGVNTWVKYQKVDASVYSEEIIRFLDYYAYLQVLHSEVHEIYFPEAGPCDANGDTDKKIINGEYDSPYTERFKVEKGWTQANLNEIANQAQVLVWSAVNKGPDYKPFSNSFYRTLACKDRVSLCASFNFPITEAKANEWFDQIYATIMDPNSNIPHFDHYIYRYKDGQGTSPDNMQNMLISLLPPPGVTDEGFYVKVMKEMDGKPLPNAKFQVYVDEACTIPYDKGDMMSDINGCAVSKKIIYPDDVPNAPFEVYVKEVSAPEGVGVSDEKITITVDPSLNNSPDNPATNTLAVFKDKPIPDKAFLRKVDAVTGESVGPATFKFKNDSFDKNFKTDDEGVLELQWWDESKPNYIPPGHYSVTEEVPPEGYLKTDEVIAVDLWVEEDGKPYSSGPIIFRNYKKLRIELLKVDENNQPLAGAEFKVMKDGEELLTQTSGPDGMIVLEDLEPGMYSLIEVKAPSGKVIPINHVFNFDLREDSEIRVHKVVCVNHDLPELIIKKIDRGAVEPLPGAEFKVTIDGNEIPTEATGDNGTIIITPENYGQYMDETKETHTVVVKEVKAPEGYDIDQPDTQTLTLKKGQTKAYFTFTDTKHGEIIIRKFKEGTTEKLPGAEFKVVIDGNELGSYTTGDTGEIHITSEEYSAIWDGKAETHSVTVTETKAPAGYLKSDPYTQTLMMNKGQKLLEFSFYDKPYSDILIVKRDKETQEALPGATFDISIDGQKIPGSPFTTDDNGEIKISYEIYKNFLNEANTGGWAVTATELTAPEGYNLDNQPESGNRSVTQILKPGQRLIPFEFEDTIYRKIRVIKKDAETNWPLEGAEFLLHSVDGQIPDRKGTTGKDGALTFDELPNGTYELKETKPPKGYSEKGTWADGGEDVKTIVLTSDCEPILTYERLNTSKSGILIRKIDAVTKLPLAGVTFRITPRSPLTGDPFDHTTEEGAIII